MRRKPLIDRVIAHTIPRVPKWLIPTLAGVVVATACGIAWVALT